MPHLVHTEVIAIRWGDMDAMGHVNNTLYFRYMEQARVAWYERLGLNENSPDLPPRCGPVIVSTGCTFLRPLTYPGEVEVKVFIGEPGRSSLVSFYEMRPTYDRGTLYAEGQAKAVWVDRDKNKSIPLPDKLRALLHAANAIKEGTHP